MMTSHHNYGIVFSFDVLFEIINNTGIFSFLPDSRVRSSESSESYAWKCNFYACCENCIICDVIIFSLKLQNIQNWVIELKSAVNSSPWYQMSGHKSFCLQTNVKLMRTTSQSGGGLAWQFYSLPHCLSLEWSMAEWGPELDRWLHRW